MTGTTFLEVPIPSTLPGGDEDRTLLAALLGAVAGQPDRKPGDWVRIVEKLESQGWRVEWGLTWTAEARRGSQHEQAAGPTRTDAFAQLEQLTMLDTVEGCP